MNKNILNPILYKKAKEIADNTYKRNGAYKSMFIVKKYKELGGKYKEDKKNNTGRWLDQKWVSVEDYLNGDIVECGNNKIGNNLCRPLFKKGQNILTIKDIIKLHSKKKLKEVINKKKKNMNLRINWETLELK